MISPSYCHRGADASLVWKTTDDALRDAVHAHADRDAIVSIAQQRRLSYAELDAAVEALARGMLGVGVQPGERVGVWSPNNVEWLVIQLATARIGALLVNVNPADKLAELEHALRLARVQTLFAVPSFRSSHYVQVLTELCPEVARDDHEDLHSAELPDLARIVIWDPNAPMETARAARGFFVWQDLIEEGELVPADRIDEIRATFDPDTPTNVQFTSGTTGAPKAVVLTHHSIVNNALLTGHVMGMSHEDRLCVPVPFYHCFGMVLSNLLCIVHGATIVVPSPHFDAAAALQAVQDERCTAMHGVPTMFVAELECLAFAKYDLSTLRTGIMAGAPCPPELVRRVIDELGCPEILIGYGQTEASPCTHITRVDDEFERRTQTVGTNIPHTETKVVDPVTDAVVPRGTTGELHFRGPHVMRGYFDNEAATRETITSTGWLRSGDLGVMHDDGYVSITGRLKDLIIRGGENIYPAEIEAFFYEHPKVAEVAVFGVPDERLGEAVAAWIQLHEGENATPNELLEYAKAGIAHYKVPRHVRIVDKFPMTVTGKIQKHRLRELADDDLTPLRDA